jgi:sugar O-acyltransferase (sialic acid O-acetyltransferase NeuD family)
MATAPAPAQAPDPRAGVTARPLVILGAGEHARVVAEAAAADPDAWRVVELVDQGTDAALRDRLDAAGRADGPWLVVGFGGPPAARRRVVEAMGADARWAVVVHPAAWVSPSARVEAGAVVLAGSVVNAGAIVGRHAIVNSRVVVEHDVRVGAFSHLAPGAIVGGGTAIGDDTTIGLGAAIRDHIGVGSRATVAMGAVVVADVPDDATVLGVPARPRPAS